jgi:hypothetical protein
MQQSVLKEAASSADYPCRTVTPDEVAHYQEFGWVKLKRFIHPDMIKVVLDTAIEQMGEDGDSNPPYGIDQPYFNAYAAGGLGIPPIREMIEGIGRNAKLLINRKADTAVRYFQDFFAPKLPSAKKTRNAGNGPTSFHQDFITFAVDRSGGMTFWIPLEAYSPDWGTMSFINKSHRMGVLGNYTSYGGKDIRDVFPELNDLEMSDSMEYELGDITVHSHMTVHGAGMNLHDKPRWTYIVLAQPADAVWDGAPPEAFDPMDMKAYQPLPDDRFPIIG